MNKIKSDDGLPTQSVEMRNIWRESGLTQTALAKSLGIPLRTMTAWYGGKRIPPNWLINLIRYYVENEIIKVK